jgi:hypothetical protein
MKGKWLAQSVMALAEEAAEWDRMWDGKMTKQDGVWNWPAIGNLQEKILNLNDDIRVIMNQVGEEE